MNTSVNLPKTTPAQRRDAAAEAVKRYATQIAWAADTLIPEDQALDMPSATQAGLLTQFLPQALTARDDMLPGFVQAIAQLPETCPPEPMAALQALPNGGFDLVSRVIAGAYFWSPAINQKLKYPGQQEIRELPDYDFLTDRIATVMARGEMYVKV